MTQLLFSAGRVKGRRAWAVGLALLAAGFGAAWAGTTEVTIPHGELELRATRFQPEGKGPFAAVVMLHGCAGMLDAKGAILPAYSLWGELLAREGYVGLLLDSFTSRGQKEICTQEKRSIRATSDRPEDARAALRWLRRDPQVDGERIYLLGWSNGGVAVLATMNSKGSSSAEDGFRAAVAMYPGCRSFLRQNSYLPSAPLLIQAGEADDWTPARYCRELVERVPAAAPKVELIVYPGAHHAFDRPGKQARYRSEVYNANSPSGRGATVQGHPQAREAAMDKALEFFKRF